MPCDKWKEAEYPWSKSLFLKSSRKAGNIWAKLIKSMQEQMWLQYLNPPQPIWFITQQTAIPSFNAEFCGSYLLTGKYHHLKEIADNLSSICLTSLLNLSTNWDLCWFHNSKHIYFNIFSKLVLSAFYYSNITLVLGPKLKNWVFLLLLWFQCVSDVQVFFTR